MWTLTSVMAFDHKMLFCASIWSIFLQRDSWVLYWWSNNIALRLALDFRSWICCTFIRIWALQLNEAPVNYSLASCTRNKMIYSKRLIGVYWTLSVSISYQCKLQVCPYSFTLPVKKSLIKQSSLSTGSFEHTISH